MLFNCLVVWPIVLGFLGVLIGVFVAGLWK